MEKKKRIVIALGGNALGNTLPEQMTAVKITARAIVDLIEEGCEVVVAHGKAAQHPTLRLRCHEPGLHRLRSPERPARRIV